MPHRRFSHPFRRALRVGVLVTVATHPAGRTARAQTLPPPPPPAVALPAYRAPVIALVQPTDTATVPQDVPVIVFRYAQGEPDDAVDLRSLSVSVNGEDRTTLFRAQDGEAWGPMSAVLPMPRGDYSVTARLCSMRGACGSASATVSVAASAVTDDSVATTSKQRRRNVIDVVLTAIRKLLLPD